MSTQSEETNYGAVADIENFDEEMEPKILADKKPKRSTVVSLVAMGLAIIALVLLVSSASTKASTNKHATASKSKTMNMEKLTSNGDTIDFTGAYLFFPFAFSFFFSYLVNKGETFN